MKKFFVLALFFLCGQIAQAEENSVEIQQSPAQENIVVTHKIEKEVLPLPECNDETLLAKTKEFLNTYFANSDNQSVLFRRRKHFLLKGLNEFTKENIANYKTPATRPVSDLIVEVQVNEKIIDENMLLCKKKTIGKALGNIYMLVYPYKNGYKVHLINIDKQALTPQTTFTYE